MHAPPSNRPLLKISILLSFIVIGFALALLFPTAMWILIFSGLLAFILKPIMKYLEIRAGMRRGFALVAIFVPLAGTLYLVVAEAAPELVQRAAGFYEQFKRYPFEQEIWTTTVGLAENIPFINAQSVGSEIVGILFSVESALESAGEDIASASLTLVLISLVAMFILAQGDIALKKLIERVPNKYFEMTLNVLHKIRRDLKGYLRGLILDAVIVCMLSIIGYWIIGLNHVVPLGIAAGVADLVPYLGIILSTIPPTVISVTQNGNFNLLIPILTVTIIVRILDNFVIQPLAFSKMVDMHPVTVFAVLFVGGQLMGIGGMLLAVPIATILKVSAKETYWGLKHYRITA
ncbi:MAG: AI-2E family transporter [Ignavibacteriae bacterium]|nr:AI-2E family transporter [Ignavibacteriota bacterium]